MKNILKLDANIFDDDLASTHLSNTFVHALETQGDIHLTIRDLSQGNIPHFNANTIAAINEGNAHLADQLIQELQQSDIIILSVPMSTFGVPSELKAWFDHVARPQVTFINTANGPVGLLENKKVYIITTQHNDQYKNTANVEIPFLSTMLGLIGLDDIEYIYTDAKIDSHTQTTEPMTASAQYNLSSIEQYIHKMIHTPEAA